MILVDWVELDWSRLSQIGLDYFRLILDGLNFDEF
jgi:hypothetical protein